MAKPANPFHPKPAETVAEARSLALGLAKCLAIRDSIFWKYRREGQKTTSHFAPDKVSFVRKYIDLMSFSTLVEQTGYTRDSLRKLIKIHGIEKTE